MPSVAAASPFSERSVPSRTLHPSPAPRQLECSTRLARWFGPSQAVESGFGEWSRRLGIQAEAEWIDQSQASWAAYVSPGSMSFRDRRGRSVADVSALTTLPRLETAFHLSPPSSSPAAEALLLWRAAPDMKALSRLAAYHVLRDDLVNARCAWALLSKHPEQRVALFCVAAAAGATEVMTMALALQPGLANITDALPAGNTPLHYAALGGHARAVTLLLSHGANASAENPLGTPPLFDAIRAGSAACVGKLATCEAMLSVNEYGDNILHRVAMYGEESRARDFVQTFETLRFAAHHHLSPGQWRRLLLAENNQRFTPLDLAVATEQHSLVRKLREAGGEHGTLWRTTLREGTWNRDTVHHGGGRGRIARAS